MIIHTSIARCSGKTYLDFPEGEESRILLDCLTNEARTLGLQLQHTSRSCYDTSLVHS